MSDFTLGEELLRDLEERNTSQTQPASPRAWPWCCHCGKFMVRCQCREPLPAYELATVEGSYETPP
jgi:hypothetical protein